MPSLESILLKVFIAVIVVVGVIIVILVVPRFLPNPATITPSTTTIDSGQTVHIGVGWKGGSAPYAVTLYSASNGACTSSSTVLSPKKDLSQPQFIFTVAPTSTTRYCGIVTSPSGSSTVSSSVVVTVNPALRVPVLTLSTQVMDAAQSATVTAKVTASGGSAPYSFTLYSGTSKACSADTTVVSVSSGVNPVVGLAGTNVQFTFAAPTATTFYCATVINSASSSLPKTSSVVKFVINPALTVSVSPSESKLDSGQSISLSAVASHGTPPYSYQWYSGSTCTTPITGQTKSSFSPGALTSTSSFSVQAADNSTGTPAAEPCVKATVTVSSALARTSVTIGPSVQMDSGQVTDLTVSWGGVGTLPYVVTLTTSFSSDCSSPTSTGMNMTDLTSPSTDFEVSPSSTTFYCATVTDSARTPESASTTSAAAVTVNPVLAPVALLSQSAVDTGQTATISVTVDLNSGTSPYTVTLYSDSSASCSPDSPIVTPLFSSPQSGANPQTGLSGPTTRFSVSAPNSNTYFCAVVTDSAPEPDTETSPSVQFVVNPVLSASVSPASPSVVKGSSISLKVVQSGGTSPILYQWYNGTTCKANKIAGQTSQVYSTVALKSTSKISVLVNDSSIGKPAGSVCVSTTVTVTAALLPTLVLSPQGVDKGQSTTVTANVTLSGGSSPYTVTLYSGSSATCSSDKTKVTVTSGSNPLTGLTSARASFTFASPSSSTYYCASVTDSAATPATVPTSTVSFAVNPALSTTLLVSPTVLDSGQSTTVTAKVTWSGGTSPYTVTLHSGSSATCSSDTVVATVSGANPLAGLTGSSTTFTLVSPGSTTYYCAVVTDTGSPHLTVSSATSSFAVKSALSVGSVVLSRLALDSGQSTTVTAKVTWSGGSSPFIVTLYSGSDPICASDTTIASVSPGSNPQTGLTGASASFTFTAPGPSPYYCASVKDASAIPVTVSSSTSRFTVNPNPTAPAISATPSAIDAGQVSTLASTTAFSGGTSPYTCQWRQEAPGASVFSNLAASFSCNTSSPPSVPTGRLSTVGVWQFELQVTDSSVTPVVVASAAATVTVNADPSAAFVISPSVLDSGQSANFTAKVTWSGGTSPYTVTLHSGSSATCSSDTVVATVSGANPLAGLTGSSTTFTLVSPGSTTYYCAVVTDGVATALTVSSTTAAFTVNHVLSVNAPALSPPTISSGQSTTVTASVSWSGGTSPYSVTLFSGSSAACTSDTTLVVPLTGSNPLTGVAGKTSSFTLASPGTSTYYCAKVSDSSALPVTTLSSASQFTVYSTPRLSPEGIASNPSTGMVYMVDPNLGQGLGHILVVNSQTNIVFATITVGGQPWGIAVNPITNVVYVTNRASDDVTVIDGLTNTVITTIAVGSQPEGIAVNPSLDLAYVADSGADTVTVIDTTGNWAIASVPVGSSPRSVAIGPSPTYTVFVTDYGSNTVSVLGLLWICPSTTICPSYGVTSVVVGNHPWGVAVNPTTNRVFVTNAGSGTVSVLNGSTLATVATITVGNTPQGIAVNPATSRVFVANAGSNSVSVIDASTNRAVTSSSPPIPIPVESDPWGIVVLSSAKLAYVTNSASNTVSVINLLSNEVIMTIVLS